MSTQFRVSPAWHNMVTTPLIEDRNMSFPFRVPPPSMAKQGTHTVYGGQKHVNSTSRARLPWQKNVPARHMNVGNMSMQFHMPPPPHGRTRYPHPI